MITATVVFSLGTSKAGLSDLRVQPLTAAGVATGTAITAGIVEQGRGIYLWSGGVPDDAAAVRVTSAGNPSAIDVLPLAGAAASAAKSYTFDDTETSLA